MVHKRPIPPRGTLHRLKVSSPALAGNILGDPPDRDVDIYLPHGHDGKDLPLLVDLAPFTNSGLAHTGWRGFEENLPERMDRLIHEGLMRPVVVAFPDAFTRLGGNQYINSPVMGDWETFLARDMLDVIEQRYGCGGAGRRGLFGKSSGGYGALMNAMRHPDVWSGAACHAGDMGFELCYLPDMPKALRALARFEGDPALFLEALETAQKPSGNDIHALMILAMSASYDPSPSDPLGVRLPVDPITAETIPERWAAWRAWDPVVIACDYADGLKKLKCLHIDCGDCDEFNLLYGARRLSRELSRCQVAHSFEEFAGGHGGIDHRLDTSLPLLAQRLA